MLVHYGNKNYTLKMPFLLFQTIKATNPHYIVRLVEFDYFNCEYTTEVEIKEVEDYSIFRNTTALKQNPPE